MQETAAAQLILFFQSRPNIHRGLNIGLQRGSNLCIFLRKNSIIYQNILNVSIPRHTYRIKTVYPTTWKGCLTAALWHLYNWYAVFWLKQSAVNEYEIPQLLDSFSNYPCIIAGTHEFCRHAFQFCDIILKLGHGYFQSIVVFVDILVVEVYFIFQLIDL